MDSRDTEDESTSNSDEGREGFRSRRDGRRESGVSALPFDVMSQSIGPGTAGPIDHSPHEAIRPGKAVKSLSFVEPAAGSATIKGAAAGRRKLVSHHSFPESSTENSPALELRDLPDTSARTRAGAASSSSKAQQSGIVRGGLADDGYSQPEDPIATDFANEVPARQKGSARLAAHEAARSQRGHARELRDTLDTTDDSSDSEREHSVQSDAGEVKSSQYGRQPSLRRRDTDLTDVTPEYAAPKELDYATSGKMTKPTRRENTTSTSQHHLENSDFAQAWGTIDEDDLERAMNAAALESHNRERIEWQNMLSSVLLGEVIKSEKRRILGNPKDTDGDPARDDLNEQIWVGIQATLRGRQLEEETRALQEARLQSHGLFQEVMNFQAPVDCPEPTEPPNESNDPDSMQPCEREVIALELVTEILHKIERLESLYPSRNAMLSDPHSPFSNPQFQERVQALNSWSGVTKSLQLQIRILQQWTGSETLDMTEKRPDRRRSIDDSAVPTEGKQEDGAQEVKEAVVTVEATSFVERILKERSLALTFEHRTLSTLRSLILKAKDSMIRNASIFAEMRLPPYQDELLTLIRFPTNFMKVALRLRLDYARRVFEPTLLVIDQLVDDFKAGISLACRIKAEYLDIITAGSDINVPSDLEDHDVAAVRSDPKEIVYGSEEGTTKRQPADDISHQYLWSLPSCIDDDYDAVIINALEFYFKLLHWKLQGGSKTAYFNEVEILQSEWAFLRSTCGIIEGGDLFAAQQICILTSRLMTGLLRNFETQMQMPSDMTAEEMTKWYTRLLDRARLKHRGLLGFRQRDLGDLFENALEFSIGDEDTTAFIHRLMINDYIMVYTDQYEHDRIYLFADPQLHNRPDIITKIMTQALRSNPESRIESEYHLLIFAARQTFAWTGPVLGLELPRVQMDLKARRLRWVANGGQESLRYGTSTLEALLQGIPHTLVSRSRAHRARINRELARITSTAFRLADAIIGSVETVRTKTKGQDCQETVEGAFAAVSDLGRNVLRTLNGEMKMKMNNQLLALAVQWVTFISDDCVPSDRRTFRWAVSALEFAMEVTNGTKILLLDERQFASLRLKVGTCMALLISHFDVLGARSSQEAAREKERQDAQREENRRILSDKLSKMKAHFGSGSNSSMQFVRDQWLKCIEDVESKRRETEQDLRIIGRVLDDGKMEDKSLVYLASSSSNINIRWQQGRFVGAGTFGSVYLAVNLDSGDLMAVKEIRFPDPTSLSTLVKQIKEEMSVMEILSHPNIVQYYGIEVHRDKVYIFMEFCQGGSLANLLEHGRIEDETVIQVYALQMAEGLVYLHAQNVVHRDIKPDSESCKCDT